MYMEAFFPCHSLYSDFNTSAVMKVKLIIARFTVANKMLLFLNHPITHSKKKIQLHFEWHSMKFNFSMFNAASFYQNSKAY